MEDGSGAEDSLDFDGDKSVKRPATKPKQEASSQAAHEDEFEQLIKQLNNMLLKDPTYALVYYKAYRLDPIIKELVPTPNEQRRSTPPPMPPPRSPAPPRTFQCEPPPHQALAPVFMRDRVCFGCKQLGHGMNFCLTLRNMMSKGTIVRNAAGRYTLPDGSPIPRTMDDSLTQALQRLSGSQSNFITAADIEETELELEYYSDSSSDDVYAVHQMPKTVLYLYGWYDDEEKTAPYIYPVETRPRNAAENRRGKYGGPEAIAPPARKELGVRESNKCSTE